MYKKKGHLKAVSTRGIEYLGEMLDRIELLDDKSIYALVEARDTIKRILPDEGLTMRMDSIIRIADSVRDRRPQPKTSTHYTPPPLHGWN